MKAFICFILCSHLPSLYQWEVLQNVIIEQASCEPCSSGYLIIEFSWFDGFTICTQLFESSHPIIFLRGHVSIPIVRFSPRSNSLFTFNEKKIEHDFINNFVFTESSFHSVIYIYIYIYIHTYNPSIYENLEK